MAFTCWFSRLRSASKTMYTHLRPRPSRFQSYTTQNAVVSGFLSPKDRNPFLWWPAYLVPISGASLFLLQIESNTSLCDSSDPNARGVGIGGQGSTEFVVKGSHRDIPRELIDDLKTIFGENMTMDYEERFFHGKPQNSFHKAVNIPDVVVFPRSEREVSLIVKSCNKHKVPIVPYGGATSIEGHTLSPHGGVCIDMSEMKNVKSLHIEDMDVVVEPGIGWMELNEYLEPHGLFFPLDPGPGATIGGMCATRCSGSLAVRYGTMRENVISIKAVLANGDIVKTGNRARKSSAGYDLTRLLIGSEGTLGVITEVTLRLQKIPQYSVVPNCSHSKELQGVLFLQLRMLLMLL